MSKPRTGAPRRVAVSLLAGALAIAGVALAAPQAGATSTVSTERLAGNNRYGTAQAVATNAASGTPTGAIVATGENFPDALAASTLAGANGPRPIVLTEANNYTAEAKAALAALKVKTATIAVQIVGGTAAVSTDVENSIKADGFTVTRVAGATRYDTAAAIATTANTTQTGGSGLIGGAKAAIFATGENFPDALAGGPIAFRNDIPLLLVTSSTVPQATQDAISTLKIKKAIILGGTTAISNDVQTQLSTLTGDTAPTRLAGSNRNSTAAAIGDYEIGTLSFPATSAVLATGLNFPDALASGPLAGNQGSPIVLTASLPAESQAFLDKYSYLITKLFVSGGTAAIDDATVAAAVAAAQTVNNDLSFTAAPELIRVEAAGTGTGSTTILRYVFDSPISTTVAFGSFKAWTAYGESVTPAASANVARDPANTSAVLAEFAAGSAVVAEATVYTVAAGAVQDTNGLSNPEGEINAAATRSFAAGITRAPDLASVAVVTADTVYDFTFDSAVATVNVSAGTFSNGGAGTGFHMVDTDGNERLASSAVLQSTTTVVRVTFPAPNSSKTGVRGTVSAGAVTDASGNLNTTEAADVTGGSTNSDAPDLVSVAIDTAASTATFTFDEVVQTLSGGTGSGNLTGFNLYYRTTNTGAAGTPASVVSTSADKSSTNGAQVVASFPTGSVNEFVAGGFVFSNTVVRSGGAVGTTAAASTSNKLDEEGVASSYVAGAFLGPQLTSVTRSNTTDLSGTVTATNLDFTWDQALTSTGAGANTAYAVVSSTGTRSAFSALGGTCAFEPSTSRTVVRCTVTASAARTAVGAARLAVVASGTVTASKTRLVGGAQFAPTTGGGTLNNHEEKSAV